MASLKKTVQETLSINGLDVAIRGNGDENDYISLTDLAREKRSDRKATRDSQSAIGCV